MWSHLSPRKLKLNTKLEKSKCDEKKKGMVRVHLLFSINRTFIDNFFRTHKEKNRSEALFALRFV